MPTKSDLLQQIYLLLAVIHTNNFVMTQETAAKIFEHWSPIMGDRPENVEEIVDSYNAILQQSIPTQSPRTPRLIERSTKKPSKTEDGDVASPFNLARSKKRKTVGLTLKSDFSVIKDGGIDDNDMSEINDTNIDKNINDYNIDDTDINDTNIDDTINDTKINDNIDNINTNINDTNINTNINKNVSNAADKDKHNNPPKLNPLQKAQDEMKMDTLYPT